MSKKGRSPRHILSVEAPKNALVSCPQNRQTLLLLRTVMVIGDSEANFYASFSFFQK